MNINTLEFKLSELKSKYEQGRGRLALLQEDYKYKLKSLQETQNNLSIWLQIQILFSKVSEYAREQIKQRIEETVTSALQAIIDDENMYFCVVMGERGSVPTAEWEVVSMYGQTEVSNSPEDSRGGGIVDIVSLALRLVLLELSDTKGPLILDEPGKMISARYIEGVAYWLKQYAQKTGRQIIMITHNQALANVADKSYGVVKKDGKSEVFKIV